MKKLNNILAIYFLGTALVMALAAAGCGSNSANTNNSAKNTNGSGSSISNSSTSTKKIIPKSIGNGFCDTGGVAGGPCLERPPEDLR